jgi:predicted PurR-regulated permease PerM
MPPRKSPAKAATTSSTASATSGRVRAPFGFILFFLLVVATFTFSTLFVISQTAREQELMQNTVTAFQEAEQRLNGLQSQVNLLSEQVSLQQAAIERLSPQATSSAGTLPAANPARR